LEKTARLRPDLLGGAGVHVCGGSADLPRS
jgi:hypothetical protein